MAGKNGERGLLLRSAQIHGRNEVEEAVADHRPHHEAREDRDELLGRRPREQEEDESLECRTRCKKEEGHVVHMEAGGESGPYSREDAKKGEERCREEE